MDQIFKILPPCESNVIAIMIIRVKRRAGKKILVQHYNVQMETFTQFVVQHDEHRAPFRCEAGIQKIEETLKRCVYFFVLDILQVFAPRNDEFRGANFVGRCAEKELEAWRRCNNGGSDRTGFMLRVFFPEQVVAVVTAFD